MVLYMSSRQGSTGRCVTQAAVEILGKRRGEQMAMLVHHSRNSVQKQWEETLVLALSGMGRILRAHLPVLVGIPGFSQVPVHRPATLSCTARLVCLHGHLKRSARPDVNCMCPL